MRIGVVSDSHGNVHSTLAAIRMLETLEVEQVLHCGDIGTTEIVPLFKQWPTHFVFGNVDYPTELDAAIRAAGQFSHGRFGTLELHNRKIALLHSDDLRRFHAETYSGTWDLICYGHTHVAKQEQVENTLVLNPGALHRANPYSLAVVDLSQMEAVIVPI